MSKRKNVQTSSPGIFKPILDRSIIEKSRKTGILNSEGVEQRNIEDSFRYSSPGEAIKSTQQIPLDYSKFENHIFFQSAQVAVQVAFDKIVNEYPFDGTQKDVEQFLDSLSGFEKWVYDRFPKCVASKRFDASLENYIEINDVAGNLHPEFSSKNTGESVLNPERNSFTFEFSCNLLSSSLDNSVIFQKLSEDGRQGISVFSNKIPSSSLREVELYVHSGTHNLSVSSSFQEGEDVYISCGFDRRIGKDELWIDQEVGRALTKQQYDFGKFDLSGGVANISKGVAKQDIEVFITGSSALVPNYQYLDARIDEFRFFHDYRNRKTVDANKKKSIFQTEKLKLYFKFNEPSSLYGNEGVLRTVLDSSGNSLHSLFYGDLFYDYNSNFITQPQNATDNDWQTLKNDLSGAFLDPTSPVRGYLESLDQRHVPDFVYDSNFKKYNVFDEKTSNVVASHNMLKNEQSYYSPILFPGHPGTIVANMQLLKEAELYDKNNANLITKLVPPHLLLEGRADEAFDTVEGDIVDPYTGESIPGSGEKGETQIIQKFLYLMARFFDELKIYLDSFGRMLHVDYDNKGGVPDQMLPQLAAYLGIDLPTFFSQASEEQYIDAENINQNGGFSEGSLLEIQNQIWRRVLVNLQDIIRSKGTLHSVKSLIRAVGIDPDSNFRFREYGGPTEKVIEDNREYKTQASFMLDFYDRSNSLINSPYLSGSRVEAGEPKIKGNFTTGSSESVHGISDHPYDGLFTSGSWTYEACYRFPLGNQLTDATQSLVRFQSTSGSFSPMGTDPLLVFNLVAISGTSNIKLYGRTDIDTSHDEQLKLELGDVDLFDGNRWNLSFGRVRPDDEDVNEIHSSSYFLRAAKVQNGKIEEFYSSSILYFPNPSGLLDRDITSVTSSVSNVSGLEFEIGSKTGYSYPINNFGLQVGAFESESRSNNFEGRVGQIRFWSSKVPEGDFLEHAMNYKSLGVKDPKVNFNFELNRTGSFERCRIDYTCEQEARNADISGSLSVFDYSQNNFHASGSSFIPEEDPFVTEIYRYSYLNPDFDEFTDFDKVQALSFKDVNLANSKGVKTGLVYSNNRAYQSYYNDQRFSIDFSISDALNQDIVNIFSTLDSLNNFIGTPESRFESEYKCMENLRRIYFNRLTEKINLKSFFEFYKWFDNSLGYFIESLLPMSTKFTGINYVIESHMLERPKFEDRNYDRYFNEKNTNDFVDPILLTQLIGLIRRY